MDEHAPGVPVAAEVVREVREEVAGCDEQRHLARGEQEQHRNQDQLTGNGRADRHLELHARREGERGDQRHGERERGGTVRREGRNHGARNDQEGQAADGRHDQLTAGEPAADAGPRRLDQGFVVGPLRGRRRGARRSGSHSGGIGSVAGPTFTRSRDREAGSLPRTGDGGSPFSDAE